MPGEYVRAVIHKMASAHVCTTCAAASIRWQAHVVYPAYTDAVLQNAHHIHDVFMGRCMHVTGHYTVRRLGLLTCESHTK